MGGGRGHTPPIYGGERAGFLCLILMRVSEMGYLVKTYKNMKNIKNINI